VIQRINFRPRYSDYRLLCGSCPSTQVAWFALYVYAAVGNRTWRLRSALWALACLCDSCSADTMMLLLRDTCSTTHHRIVANRIVSASYWRHKLLFALDSRFCFRYFIRWWNQSLKTWLLCLLSICSQNAYRDNILRICLLGCILLVLEVISDTAYLVSMAKTMFATRFIRHDQGRTGCSNRPRLIGRPTPSAVA